MTTGPVEQALQQSLWRAGQGMVFGADRDFLSTLTVGQIIKGRVLRHYEGGRYGVEFGGQERVVDSTIALRSGDVVHGRVVGLDDRVHLQRVAVEPGPERAADRPPAQAAAAARPGDAIERLFREHRAALSPAEHAAVRTLGRQLGDPSLAASAALVLRKLGLPLDAGLVRAVAGALTERGRPAPAAVTEDAGRLAADATRRVPDNHATVRLLAEALEQLRVPERPGDPARAESGSGPDGAGRTDGDAGPGVAADGGAGGRGQPGPFPGAWLLGRRVLNSQDEGAVAHRYFTLPLWLGGRLVEIDLALFAQTPAAPEPDGLRHRRIVLSLELEGLGRIEAVVTVANDRVRVAFETAREEATQLLALWMGSLKADLAAFGWRLDELSYGTRYADALDGPAEAVVTHYIRQDSVSRLM